MLQEFKEFISRGNVVDLAVAVVIGAAFGAVVKSFTDDVLMQLIAAVGGQPDFSKFVVTIGDTKIRYGSFLTAVISFLILAWAVFLIVKALNAAQRLGKKDEAEAAEAAGPTELEVLLEIRDLLTTRA